MSLYHHYHHHHLFLSSSILASPYEVVGSCVYLVAFPLSVLGLIIIIGKRRCH